MLRRALHGRRNEDALRTFVRARCAQRQQKARGDGDRGGARRGNEFRVAAKRARKVRSDEIRFRGHQRSHHALWNMKPARWPERGHEPPRDGRSDAFGDESAQESGHHCPRHTSLDATERAGGRVIADDDEHCVGCQISNALERGAEVSFHDDRVRLVRRHGIDERVLCLGDRDDVKPTRPELSLHVADAARRDHAELVVVRPPLGGRSLSRGGTFEDRHDLRLLVDQLNTSSTEPLCTIVRATGHVARWFYGAAPPGRHPFGQSTPPLDEPEG